MEEATQSLRYIRDAWLEDSQALREAGRFERRKFYPLYGFRMNRAKHVSYTECQGQKNSKDGQKDKSPFQCKSIADYIEQRVWCAQAFDGEKRVYAIQTQDGGPVLSTKFLHWYRYVGQDPTLIPCSMLETHLVLSRSATLPCRMPLWRTRLLTNG